MRALICTDTYLPQVNGVSVVTERSVTGLIRRGWEVGVVAPRYPRAGAAPPESDAAFGRAIVRAPRLFPIASIPAPRYPEVRLALPDLFAMLRAFASTRPDIVHCATEGVIGRMGDAGEPPIGLALGARVAVDQDLLRPTVARRADVDRLLPAGDVTYRIGVGAVLHRHRGVVLGDAPLHLREERRLQRLGSREHRRGMGVLGVEMGADLRIEHARIAHHLLPVLGPEPGPVVDEIDPVDGGDGRPAGGLRRRGGGMRGEGGDHADSSGSRWSARPLMQ